MKELTSTVTLGRAAGLLTGGVGVVAALKSLVEVGSGHSLGLQRMAFYLGGAVFCVYGGVVGAIMVGAGLALVTNVFVGEDWPEGVAAVVVCIDIAAGLALLIVLAFAGVVFDYNGTDGFGRAFTALCGLAAVTGGLYLWRSRAKKEKAQAEAQIEAQRGSGGTPPTQ
jgi:hypothetical protein